MRLRLYIPNQSSTKYEPIPHRRKPESWVKSHYFIDVPTE